MSVHTPIVCTECNFLRSTRIPEWEIRRAHNAGVSERHKLPELPEPGNVRSCRDLQSGTTSDKVAE